MKEKQNKFLTKLARLQKKHWVLTLVFVTLPAFWLPLIYTFWGTQLKLVAIVEQTSQVTPIGFFLMGVCFLVVFVGSCATIYDEKVNGKNSELEELNAELLEQKENGFVLRDLNGSANSICESKLLTLVDQVDYFRLHPEKAPSIISNPRKQLDSLCKELSICLAGLLKFQDRRNVSDLFTSIIYRFPQDSDTDWHWATSERGLSIPDLLAEKDGRKSTFRSLLDNKGHSVFKNSKQLAFDNDQYIPDDEDEYDENGKLTGSIACYQYQIKKNDKVIVEFVVTISSYTQQFVQGMADGDDVVRNVKHNLEKVVMRNYMIRAKIELCLLYIEYLNKGNP